MNKMEFKRTTNNLPTLLCYFQIRFSRHTSNDWDDASIEIFKRLFSNGGESDLVYAKILSVLPRVRSDQILDSNRLIYYCKLLSNPPFIFSRAFAALLPTYYPHPPPQFISGHTVVNELVIPSQMSNCNEKFLTQFVA